MSVFKGYASKSTPDRIAYYRHRAMRSQFVRFDSQWYLEVTPSYHFTHNGWVLSRHFNARLSGIKILERQNKGHLRQLRLWAEVLQQTHLHTPDARPRLQRSLFTEPDDSPTPPVVEPYPYLTFGPLVDFQVDCGVPEAAWLPAEDGLEADENDDQGQGRLFQR